jgi:hypothetical protein
VALIRPFLLGLLVYIAIVLCYPEWTGKAYHVIVLAAIGGGAAGVWALTAILDLGSGAAKIGLEAAFLVTIALFLGYTMPQRSGKPPFQQWAEGVRPTRDTAQRGFNRLRIDPNGPVASVVVKLFPKR